MKLPQVAVSAAYGKSVPRRASGHPITAENLGSFRPWYRISD
jgi:hypothetical protein